MWPNKHVHFLAELRLDAEGNVGVGTTATVDKLNVGEGDVNVDTGGGK